MTIAVFLSRTQLFSFVHALRGRGIQTNIISTPQEAGVGCGLSAEFSDRFYALAQIVAKANTGFVGFYKYYGDRNKKLVKLL